MAFLPSQMLVFSFVGYAIRKEYWWLFEIPGKAKTPRLDDSGPGLPPRNDDGNGGNGGGGGNYSGGLALLGILGILDVLKDIENDWQRKDDKDDKDDNWWLMMMIGDDKAGVVVSYIIVMEISFLDK